MSSYFTSGKRHLMLYYEQTDNILLTQRQVITDLFVCTYILNINSMLNQCIRIHKHTIFVNDIILPSSCITLLFFYYYCFFFTSCHYRYILHVFVFDYIWTVMYSYSNTFLKGVFVFMSSLLQLY